MRWRKEGNVEKNGCYFPVNLLKAALFIRNYPCSDWEQEQDRARLGFSNSSVKFVLNSQDWVFWIKPSVLGMRQQNSCSFVGRFGVICHENNGANYQQTSLIITQKIQIIVQIIPYDYDWRWSSQKKKTWVQTLFLLIYLHLLTLLGFSWLACVYIWYNCISNRAPPSITELSFACIRGRGGGLW